MAGQIRCKNKRLFQVPILRQLTGNNAVNGSFISFLKYYLAYIKNNTFLSAIVSSAKTLNEFIQLIIRINRVQVINLIEKRYQTIITSYFLYCYLID